MFIYVEWGREHRRCDNCACCWPALNCRVCPKCGWEESSRITSIKYIPPKSDNEQQEDARRKIIYFFTQVNYASMESIVEAIMLEYNGIRAIPVRLSIFYLEAMGKIKDFHGVYKWIK